MDETCVYHVANLLTVHFSDTFGWSDRRRRSGSNTKLLRVFIREGCPVWHSFLAGVEGVWPCGKILLHLKCCSWIRKLRLIHTWLDANCAASDCGLFVKVRVAAGNSRIASSNAMSVFRWNSHLNSHKGLCDGCCAVSDRGLGEIPFRRSRVALQCVTWDSDTDSQYKWNRKDIPEFQRNDSHSTLTVRSCMCRLTSFRG